MRTHTLLRPTTSLFKGRTSLQYSLSSYSYSYRHPRERTFIRSPCRTHSRSSSSATPSFPPRESDAGPDVVVPSTSEPLEDPHEDEDKRTEAEKPKRRKSSKTSDSDKDIAPSLPAGLNILWCPSQSDPPSPLSVLPPPEILREALNNLLITLHPQTQHRATYTSSAGPSVEPTLALYCPIEGGDYIIDETVRELARKTGSDVVVLDAVQLAAGEWGAFEKAASAIQLPHNPLHFPAVSSRTTAGPTGPPAGEEEDDGPDFSTPVISVSPMTLHVMTHGGSPSIRAGRPTFLSSPARGSPVSKIRTFFDELVNISLAPDAEMTPLQGHHPRLIYIRDFPTLAPSATVWYPPLLSSVRQRRQGPMARPSSPITNPMTIIFGMTPSIIPSASFSPNGMTPQGVLGLILNRQASSTLHSFSHRSSKNEYGEDEFSDKARERRLRERLRKWERGDPSLQDDLPSLPHASIDASGASNSSQRSGVVIVGPNGSGSLPPGLAALLQNRDGGQGEDPNSSARFFRSSVLVPAARSPPQEQLCRMSRRREINQLTMRMGVGAVGGILGQVPQFESQETDSTDINGTDNNPQSDDASKMWDEWSRQVEAWPHVKDIADRAVGSVVASGATDVPTPSKASLEPTPIPWSAVISAWVSQRSSREVRKAWIHESSGRPAREQQENEEEDNEEADEKDQMDEVVQQVKQDPDLSQHEHRLLGCIVDATSMPTSFSQVHLPLHTIDSVRTLVSLPLLHPAAFQQGILKQHSMTGCLLFGPPGTGKTLIVRALAKEAGCRMLSVSPSDVMDMYVGEGEKLVKSVFSLARRLSPCVIFLDEIDALFGARMSARETGGAIAHRGVITEFMQEMDGLKTNKDSNVIVIGATNRPFDLDDAVLRRLPRRLLVDLPGEKERTEILKILLRDETVSADVDFHVLAKKTELFSGSDLKHLCVSAALDAVKERVVVPWDVPRLATSPTTLSSGMADRSPDELPKASSETLDVGDPSLLSASTEESMTDSLDSNPLLPPSSTHKRTLCLRNFNKALKEITPSSSESLGSLAALRKWNEEFGEGQTKKRKAMWGKGLFGFAEKGTETVPDGQVSGRDAGAVARHSDGER